MTTPALAGATTGRLPPWLERADELIAMARNAQAAGDIVAVIALSTAAAQCVQVAKQLKRADDALTAIVGGKEG